MVLSLTRIGMSQTSRRSLQPPVWTAFYCLAAPTAHVQRCHMWSAIQAASLTSCCGWASACGRVARGQSSQQAEEERIRLKAIELGWKSDNAAYNQFFAALHMPDLTAEQFRAYNDLVRRTTSAANAVAIMRSLHRADIRDIVPKVRCRTLVMHSRNEQIISFEEGRAVAALIPGARLVPIESRNQVIVSTEPAWQQFVDALDEFLVDTPSQPIVTNVQIGDLTRREAEILELLAQGLANDVIGSRLGISPKTVRNQVSVIFGKLGVSSRALAIVRARDAGFGRGAGLSSSL